VNFRHIKSIQILVIFLITSCGTGDQPEVPPTTILGSPIIFTYEEGVVECQTVGGEVQTVDDDITMLTDLKIRCFAAMPGANAIKAEATKFSPEITGILWKPLNFKIGVTTLTITNYLIETSGIGAVYTVPAAQVTEDTGEAKATLEVARSEAEKRSVDYNYNWVATPTPTPTPTP
jgi:hypothetical protein